MNEQVRRVRRAYFVLTALSTLSASLIWGINTLFLLDAGLSNTQAFGANAFFTAGQVAFEIPTGVVADVWGRRMSYLLGAATLLVSTLLYLLMWQTRAPFWGWAASSVVIGLGFTFFSGAVEAWLVDALKAAAYEGDLETVFARGQSISGVAMLFGSVTGGVVAQLTTLGVPYMIRAALLMVTLVSAWFLVHDEGFRPQPRSKLSDHVRGVLRSSVDNGWRIPTLRWLMLAAPFSAGAGVFAFYAMQPYLLELYGDDAAFGIAGLAAAVVAGAQILGGMLVPLVRRVFKRKSHALIASGIVGVVALAGLGLVTSFWAAIALLVIWAVSFSAAGPMRQALVNGLIPSSHRATVLSFDALIGSAGGVASQPLLGRAADVWGYATSYALSSAAAVVALPFLIAARRQDAPADRVEGASGHP